MRVAIDYTPAIRQGAGIGRYTRGLIQALAELDENNQYVLFCAGGATTEEAWPPNFRVRSSSIPSRWLTAGWHRMRLPVPAEVLAGACDLFHSPDFVLPPLRRAVGIDLGEFVVQPAVAALRPRHLASGAPDHQHALDA